MESKLHLNLDLVAKARASAAKVADDVQEFIDVHTTVTVERAICRLLGIDNVNDVDVPLPNVVVDHLQEKGILSGGAIALMIDWRVALVVWGGFLILAIATRYVSLGSCWAGASFPFATWYVYQNELLTVLSVMIGGLILWKHRGNIVRPGIHIWWQWPG